MSGNLQGQENEHKHPTDGAAFTKTLRKERALGVGHRGPWNIGIIDPAKRFGFIWRTLGNSAVT